MRELKAVLPDNLKIALIGDQSLFVSGAISGVVTRRRIAAALTSLMILLFLGSWRSTVIIAISIPLVGARLDRDAVGARRDAQHHDASAASRSRSASWSTTRP